MDNDKDRQKRRRRIIITIIILIIIILLLITSCTCTGLAGKIGDLFANQGDYTIEPDTNDADIVLNKDLKFDALSMDMYLSDENGKLSFYYENINPDEFTCVTSDASIATCYVENNHVVINPKKTGKVEVTLEAKTNGKIYRATASVNINESNRYIKLSRYKGTINLYNGNILRITYSLINLNGDVKVSVDNLDIANIKVKDGIITIKGKKVGKTNIIVTVTDNNKEYKANFELNVVDKKPDTLKNLTSDKGNLNFDANKKSYYLNVENKDDFITFNVEKENSKDKLTYEFNGKKVDSLKDLPLQVGENHLKIEVLDEYGNKTVYDITINRASESENSNTNLDNLTVSDGKLNPSFESDIFTYSLNVSYNTKQMDIESKLHNNGAKVTYKFNGKVVNNLDDLKLNPGHNLVEVVVESDNEIKTYTIDIYRNIRTVDIDLDNYEILAGNTYNILFNIYEEGILVKESDYDINDVKVNIDGFEGKIEVSKGVIKLTPEYKMGDLEKNLNVTYDASTDSAHIKFIKDNYSVSTPNNELKLDIVKGVGSRDLIINNNMFSGNVKSKKIPGGIRIYDEANPDNYIDVLTDGDVTLEYVNGTNSVVVKVTGNKNTTDFSVNVEGHANGNIVNNFTVNFTVSNKYLLVLDAQADIGGFFDELTNRYEFKLEESTFDLTNYLEGYREVDCKYYPLIGFSDAKDGKVIYDKDNPIVNLTNDLTLYAIYSEENITDPITEEKTLYLADVDLFYNEEHFELYGKEKVIYPGATGYYIMSFTNNSGKTITIKSISLEETQTVCIDNECLNMGYVIKDYRNNYYLGAAGSNLDNDIYEVLNKHDDINIYPVSNPDIVLNDGEKTEITLLWRWLDNDKNDTKIGEYAASQKEDTIYAIWVGINFTSEKDSCETP